MSVFPPQTVRKLIKELSDMYVPKYETNEKLIEVERFEDKIVVDGVEVKIKGIVRLASRIYANANDRPSCDAEVELTSEFVAAFRVGRERKPRVRKVTIYISPHGAIRATTDDGIELKIEWIWDFELEPRIQRMIPTKLSVRNVKEEIVDKILNVLYQYFHDKAMFYQDKYRDIRNRVEKILRRKWERYHKERWLRKFNRIFKE